MAGVRGGLSWNRWQNSRELSHWSNLIVSCEKTIYLGGWSKHSLCHNPLINKPVASKTGRRLDRVVSQGVMMSTALSHWQAVISGIPPVSQSINQLIYPINRNTQLISKVRERIAWEEVGFFQNKIWELLLVLVIKIFSEDVQKQYSVVP